MWRSRYFSDESLWQVDISMSQAVRSSLNEVNERLAQPVQRPKLPALTLGPNYGLRDLNGASQASLGQPKTPNFKQDCPVFTHSRTTKLYYFIIASYQNTLITARWYLRRQSKMLMFLNFWKNTEVCPVCGRKTVFTAVGCSHQRPNALYKCILAFYTNLLKIFDIIVHIISLYFL